MLSKEESKADNCSVGVTDVNDDEAPFEAQPAKWPIEVGLRSFPNQGRTVYFSDHEQRSSYSMSEGLDCANSC